MRGLSFPLREIAASVLAIDLGETVSYVIDAAVYPPIDGGRKPAQCSGFLRMTIALAAAML
jgi:hypothetical protein